MSKLCLIFNTAPFYRTNIYCSIDKEYDCKWVFGPKRDDIKEMDFSLLKDVSYYTMSGKANILSIKKGMLSYLFNKEYQTYLMYPEVHSLTDWLFFFLAFTIFKKKKIYLWTHGWYGKESKMGAILKLWLFRHVTGIFSYSNYACDLMIKQGIVQDKIYIIHNSLDYDKQLKLRKELQPSSLYKNHFSNDNPTLIFIGRLTKVKKLDMLLEAVASLKEQGYDYNLIFVGDGIERESLESNAKNLDIEKQVWFYGACYDEKTNAELIFNADLCVAPGNVGLTAIHTMVFGTPVITHNAFEWQMPEFEAIRKGVTGSFFEKDNLQSLTDQIKLWFSDKQHIREDVRNACYKEIDTSWNPHYQMEVIRKNLKNN